MTDEPLYNQVKKDTGIDPDKIITDGMARDADLAYAGDMETTAETIAEETVELEEEPGRVLTRHDRCDMCRAEAKGYATKNDSELLFCGHHLRDYTENLTKQGFEVVDLTPAEVPA